MAFARVCSIGNELQAQRFLLAAEGERCRVLARYITVPLQVINAFTGTGSAFSATVNYSSMSWQEFFLALVVILGTILNGMHAAFGFGNRQADIDTAYFKMNEMANRVQNFVVSGDKQHEADVLSFLETLTLEYEHTLQSMPNISQTCKQMLATEMKTLGEDLTPNSIRLLQVPKKQAAGRKREILQTPKRPHISLPCSSEGSQDSDKDDLFKKSVV